ncbi:MAG: hypothetical protein E7252_07520 [Lachnospira sp.]|nr:hypothetical protein [Lachnospira sp.]
MKKVLKGNIGYIRYKKTSQLLKSLLGIAIIVALVFIGIKLHGNRNNVITVIAAVTAIPTGKALVGFFMFIKYKSLDKSRADELSKLAGSLLPIYELVLSTKEKAFHADVAFINLENIIICSDSDIKDTTKLEKEIEKFLKVEDIKINVKIFTDEKLFEKRIASISSKDTYTDKDKEQMITIANKLLILNI